jgi:hypothetical protein
MPLGIYGELPDRRWNQEIPRIFLKEYDLQHTVKECHPVVFPADLSCMTCTEQGSMLSTAGNRHFHFMSQVNTLETTKKMRQPDSSLENTNIPKAIF